MNGFTSTGPTCIKDGLQCLTNLRVLAMGYLPNLCILAWWHLPGLGPTGWKQTHLDPTRQHSHPTLMLYSRVL